MKTKTKDQLINEHAQIIDGKVESIIKYAAFDGSNLSEIIKWARSIRASAADVARLTSEVI